MRGIPSTNSNLMAFHVVCMQVTTLDSTRTNLEVQELQQTLKPLQQPRSPALVSKRGSGTDPECKQSLACRPWFRVLGLGFGVWGLGFGAVASTQAPSSSEWHQDSSFRKGICQPASLCIRNMVIQVAFVERNMKKQPILRQHAPLQLALASCAPREEFQSVAEDFESQHGIIGWPLKRKVWSICTFRHIFRSLAIMLYVACRACDHEARCV